MSEYEKFLFDLKGFLVIPGVLTDGEVRTVREHTEILLKDPESLREHHRAPIAGPAEFLIDHPRVMGILQEVIDPRRERIRLESVFISSRSVENTRNQWNPHVGGTNLDPSLSYRFHNGRIYSGMTRIVWELNEVRIGQGGTCLVPGSHKANLASAQDETWPQEADDPNSGVWETYGCPPGSLIVFSEGVRHTGSSWTNPDNPRRAILIAYNHITVRFHEPKPCMNPKVIASMSEARQKFFQDVWILGNDLRKKQQTACPSCNKGTAMLCSAVPSAFRIGSGEYCAAYVRRTRADRFALERWKVRLLKTARVPAGPMTGTPVAGPS